MLSFSSKKAQKELDNVSVTDGSPQPINEVLYHGSQTEFSSFLPSVSNVRGYGIFFSDSVKYAKRFGNFVYACSVNLANPKIYANSSDFTVAEMTLGGNAENLTRKLFEDGFDGVVIERSKVASGIVREVICFNPSSITNCKIL